MPQFSAVHHLALPHRFLSLVPQALLDAAGLGREAGAGTTQQDSAGRGFAWTPSGTWYSSAPGCRCRTAGTRSRKSPQPRNTATMIEQRGAARCVPVRAREQGHGAIDSNASKGSLPTGRESGKTLLGRPGEMPCRQYSACLPPPGPLIPHRLPIRSPRFFTIALPRQLLRTTLPKESSPSVPRIAMNVDQAEQLRNQKTQIREQAHANRKRPARQGAAQRADLPTVHASCRNMPRPAP